MFKGYNMLYLYVALGGLLIGSGATFGVLKKREEPVVVEVPEPVIVDGSKVGDKLASIDLVSIPCSLEFIESHGDLLCREMFCRMQQRGLDSKTSSADCAGISNMSNTILFIGMVAKHCEITQQNTDDYNKCYERFSRILTTGKSAQ
jgi:hypothetical protein